MTYSQVLIDYPDKITTMLDELIYSNINARLEDVDFFYYWTIISSPDHMEEYKHLLFFNERLEYELDKVIVEMYIKHKTYIRGEDVTKLIKPSVIRDELSRIIVTSMLIEQKVFDNKDVIDSIPLNILPIDVKFGNDLLIDPGNLNLNDYDYDYIPNVIEEVHTLDEILEKISNHGMESLTTNEKEILDDLSNKD